MGQTGAQILEIDWKTDMGLARQSVPESTVLMGNIDPSDPMCIGTPEKVKAQIQDMIVKTKGKNIIISSGCALGANTKPENMVAWWSLPNSMQPGSDSGAAGTVNSFSRITARRITIRRAFLFQAG